MEQYIPKAAVVAEIERRIATYKNVSGADRRTDALISFKNFLDTLEVIEIGVDIGSPEGDIGVKTIWNGDKIVSNKVQKRE